MLYIYNSAASHLAPIEANLVREASIWVYTPYAKKKDKEMGIYLLPPPSTNLFI